MCLPVPGSHWLLCPGCVMGEGRAAGGPLFFVVVSLGSVGCTPCPLGSCLPYLTCRAAKESS